VISAIDAADEYIVGQSIELPGTKTQDNAELITMPRDEAICDHVVAAGELLVVDDTQRDPRFADHPAIRLWNTKFYAGAPLKTADGMVLGALCLLDSEPRTLSEEERTVLDSMAADVISVMTGNEAVQPPSRQKKNKSSTGVAQKVPD
jgi:GAF domain-containing protein